MFAAFSFSAWSQENADVAQRLAQSSDNREALTQALLAYEDTLNTHCKKLDLEADVHIVVLRSIQLDKNGHVADGAWKETVLGAACGVKRLYNAFVDVHGGKPAFTYMLPGTSDADPELQQDTFASLPQVVPAAKSCSIEVLDTRLDGRHAQRLSNGLAGRWREKWEIRACQKLYTVSVLFIPDSSGTGVSISPKDVVRH